MIFLTDGLMNCLELLQFSLENIYGRRRCLLFMHVFTAFQLLGASIVTHATNPDWDKEYRELTGHVQRCHVLHPDLVLSHHISHIHEVSISAEVLNTSREEV